MEWFLVIWLFYEGQWIQGDRIEGWQSIPQPSKEICLVKLKKAFDLNIDNPNIRFTCIGVDQ